MTVTSASVETRQPLFSVVRLIIVAILVLAFANAIFLYVFPSRADTDFAWPIKPPVNAMFMGAGYLIGGVITVFVLWKVNSWRTVRVQIPGVIILSAIMFAATMIHRDRFDWGYPLTWLWTAVYALIPPVGLIVWFAQERSAPPPPADPRLRPVRLICGIAAVPVIALVVAMVLVPDDLTGHTPWPMSPLLLRVDAGWCALVGAALVTAALSLRQAREGMIFFLSAALWAVLTLLAPLRYPDDMLTGRAGFWLWLGLQLAMLAGFLVLGLWVTRIARTERQPL